MIWEADYTMKYPIVDTLLTAAIGIVTVVTILATIACLILLLSKVIRTLESKGKGDVVEAAAAPAAVAAPVGDPLPETESQGELTLIKTDEQTAAMIMAIVSDMSGIPLNKLCFHSIKLMEDEN